MSLKDADAADADDDDDDLIPINDHPTFCTVVYKLQRVIQKKVRIKICLKCIPNTDNSFMFNIFSIFIFNEYTFMLTL